MPRKIVRKTIRPKRGSLSNKDKAFIATHKDRHTAEQIAGRLCRTVKSVKAFMDTLTPPTEEARLVMSLGEELETRPEWANFRQQFTSEELEHFKYRYVQLMGQFKEEGILPTEEMQLYQVITMDILVQRTMREQREVNDDMRHSHAIMEKARLDFETTGDRSFLDILKAAEVGYAKCADQLKGLSDRYQAYMGRQSAMLKELKATRDQRVKVLENSRQSFLGYLRALTDEDQRRTLGNEAGMMVAASDVADGLLREPHEYADGMVDQPLLTPEDVREY